MKFNALVKTHLLPILQKNGFDLIEEYKNILRFESASTKVGIVCNDYEKSHLAEIGKQGEMSYPLNNDAIEFLFSLDLPIEQVTSEVFIRNLSLLFEQQEGIKMLRGDVNSLENFIKQQSGNYTSKLVQRQALEVASKAWKDNDYEVFVKIIDKVGIDKIPGSYQQKYKIAKKKCD